MATNQYEGHGITVTTYAGPIEGDKQRKRVQLAVGERFVVMDMDQWRALGAITDLLGPECRGYHIGREDGT